MTHYYCYDTVGKPTSDSKMIDTHFLSNIPIIHDKRLFDGESASVPSVL